MNKFRVERLNHNRRDHFADLFNQYNFYLGEISREKPLLKRMGERFFDNEPILFMALRSYAESIPVGFIRLYSMYSSANAVMATIINDLYVLPDYRNNGIALKLIEAAVKFAIYNKSALIQLETLQDNLIAQKLFESVGFKSQTSDSELNVYYIRFEFH